MPLPKVLSITPSESVRVTGRLSDGSDREEIRETLYTVLLEDGRTFLFESEPTDEQILNTIRVPSRRLKPTTNKQDLEDAMEGLFAEWQRWKITRLEAIARNMPASVINALTNKEDSVWAEYVQSIQAWRTA